MPRSSKLYTFMLLALVGAGAFPLVYFVSVETGIAQAAVDSTEATSVDSTEFGRYIENVAFGVGERLEFDINYGFINAGSAVMEATRLVEFEGRPCYQIVTTANSNKFFSSFYTVDDRVESIMDAVGLFSWHFEKRLREGNYRSERMHRIDQRNHVAYYNDKDTIEVTPFIQDALSALYYIRTQNLEPGKSVFVDNFTDGKRYPLEVKVHRRERITVKAGTFDCLVVEPLMRSVGVFKHEGKLTVYLTDDLVKLPVLMKSKVLVGSISAELTDYHLGELELF